jgi:hypothetical protein
MTTDYTTLSVSDLEGELSAIARDTPAVFGGLHERQLNWRPDATRWSVAQCFDHLLRTNRKMFEAVDAALDGSHPRTVWQRLPVLPGLFGRMLIRSQAPVAKRKFTAPRQAVPASSAIDPGILDRFVAQQHEALKRLRSLEGRDAARVIMVSPFAAFITYSVLDGYRLLVTHERRHFEQARRVTQVPGFSGSA